MIGRVFAAAHGPDIRGVVGTRRRSNGGVAEKPFLDAKFFDIRCREQHDVDNVLGDHRADLFEVLRQSFPAAFRLVVAVTAGTCLRARGGDAEGHVGILGVGDDEVLGRA